MTTLGGFIAGGVAACGAVTFTNPIELVKTRMQLQGELSKLKGQAKLYKNPLQLLQQFTNMRESKDYNKD